MAIDTFQAFLARFRPDLTKTYEFTTTTIDGGTNPQSASESGIEAVRVFNPPAPFHPLTFLLHRQNLDIQYTVGLASGVPTTFISVGDNYTDDLDGFLDIINLLLSDAQPPQVLTTSYGQNENSISQALAVYVFPTDGLVLEFTNWIHRVI